jgi:c-di-GMP-binding flagellar brake protein YcgR
MPVSLARTPGPRDQRADFRFDKIIQVSYASEEFAEVRAFARNISAGGMLIETAMPPALGTQVRIHFQIPDSQASICVRAEVKNHYVFNYVEQGEPRVARGMGVRFLEFMEDGGERMRLSITRWRVLH